MGFMEDEISAKIARLKEQIRKASQEIIELREMAEEESILMESEYDAEYPPDNLLGASDDKQPVKKNPRKVVQPVKLKISLEGVPHKCERILMVPEDISMRQLHFFIQVSMGWWNSHLFEFSHSKVKPRIRVGMPDDYDFEYTPPRQDAHHIMLKKIFIKEFKKKAFWYNYDFGDDWWHRVSFLKPTEKELTMYVGSPICLKAVGKCPPEDVGGIHGYTEFLAIINDPTHWDYKDMCTWANWPLYEPYLELKVDLQRINLELKKFYTSVEYNLDQYDDIPSGLYGNE